ALTDSEVLAGIAVAEVYSTRMTSSLHTCTLNRPGFKVNVTPVASTVKALPVGGAPQARPPVPPVPTWPPPPAVPPLPARPPPVPVAPPVLVPPVPVEPPL